MRYRAIRGCAYRCWWISGLPEAHPDLAARFHVQGVPNFVVLHNGRVVAQRAGVTPRTEMRRWLEQAAAPAA